MSQDWTTADPLTRLGTWVKTDVQNMLNALRSVFSGATDPASTVAYMLHVHTGDSLLKQRDASDASSVTIAPLLTDLGYQIAVQEIGGLSASQDIYLGAAKQKTWKIHRVRILSDTTTVSSDGSNNWAFQIRNLTQSLDLLATAKNTNGAEITADTVYDVDADQNQTVAVDDVLELQITKTGAPTNLTRASIQLEFTTSVA